MRNAIFALSFALLAVVKDRLPDLRRRLNDAETNVANNGGAGAAAAQPDDAASAEIGGLKLEIAQIETKRAKGRHRRPPQIL